MVKTFSPILNCANFRNIWSFQTFMYEGWSKGLELKWIVGSWSSVFSTYTRWLTTASNTAAPGKSDTTTLLYSHIHIPIPTLLKAKQTTTDEKKWYFLMKPALFRLWWENFSHRISKTLFQTHENSGCEAEWNINAFLFQRRPYRTTAHTNTDTKTLA